MVVVHSLALGEYGVLAFDFKQSAEIWLTAAQSFFAIALLIRFEISVGEAVTLLGLFLSQVLLEFAIIRDIVVLPVSSTDLLLVYTGIYVVLGTALFVSRRRSFGRLLRRTAGTIGDAMPLIGTDRTYSADD